MKGYRYDLRHNAVPTYYSYSTGLTAPNLTLISHNRARRTRGELRAGLISHLLKVRPVGLNGEPLKRWGKMLTNAVEWYERNLKKKDERAEYILSKDEFSGLTQIKASIRDGTEIKGEIHVRLLTHIIDDYEVHLKGIRSLDYVNKSRIDEEISEISKFKGYLD